MGVATAIATIAAPVISRTANGIRKSPRIRLPASHAQSTQLAAPNRMEPITNTEEE